MPKESQLRLSLGTKMASNSIRTLQCKLNCSRNWKWRWLKLIDLFFIINFFSLQDQSTQLDDSVDIFEYRCKAEIIVGQIEHTVKVIRSGSLFFTEKLKNLTVTEGTILNWPCLAQSNAEITYKWFKNSVVVRSTLSRWSDRGALFQDGMLYLLKTYRNDSGLYECHAYTANKRIETSAYLNVLCAM